MDGFGGGEKTRRRTRDLAEGPAGFTLLEVLVALSLLGLAVTVVMQLFSANVRALAASESYVACVIEGRAKMREVLEDPELGEGVQSGLTPNGYRYQVTVSEEEKERSENLTWKLLAVELRLFWREGQREKTVAFRTLKVKEKKP